MKSYKTSAILLVLLSVLLVLTYFSIKFGAVEISSDDIIHSLKNVFNEDNNASMNERIFMQIRLPRVIMGMFVGAALAVGGVLMQALFRNPIVEPGLIGTSSGAAFGSSLYFVLGSQFLLNFGEWTLPLSACLGALLSTGLVLSLSKSKYKGNNSVLNLLLVGIAVNALFFSGVGFMSYIARDPQARSITFWNLGTLSGSHWQAVLIVLIVTVICILYSYRFAKQLNALMMGEQEAFLLGVNIKTLKLKVLLANVIMVAVATAFVGVIGFIGLVVPHLLRLINGSDNRYLIPTAAVLGAIVLTASDLCARMLLAPAELPIGIVTSLIGVPVFVVLLKRSNLFL
jgi:iron complex transport system permease protein